MDLYKNALLPAMGIMVVGLAFLVVKWPQTKHFSFSQHAVAQRISIAYYIALFTITLPLLAFFFFGWFVPQFKPPLTFSILIATSLICQYSVVLVPEIGGWKTYYHRIVTGISGAILIPALVLLLLSNTIDEFSKYAIGFAVGVMTLVIAATLKNHNKMYMLALQSLYYGAFFIAIIITTYLI